MSTENASSEKKLEAKIIEENVEKDINHNNNQEEIKTEEPTNLQEETKKEELIDFQEEIKNEEPNDLREDKILNKKSNSKRKNVFFIILTIFLSLLIIFLIFAIINNKSNKIFAGVKIDNINIQGLTKDQAISILQEKIDNLDEIKIEVDGTNYNIAKEKINLKYDINQALETAYNEGRQGNIFKNNYNIIKDLLVGKNVKTRKTFDVEKLQQELDKIDAKVPEGFIENTYSVENNNLIIKKGKKGKAINLEDLKEKIQQKVYLSEQEEISAILEEREPKILDANKILKKVNENINWEFNLNIEEANKILEKDQEEYKIPLNIKITEQNFPNLLGKCTTKYDETIQRATNIKLSAKALDGKVILPGEIFSLNKAVGKRTTAKGYKNGCGFSGGREVPMIGGGICQTSSTLYNAAIYANLEIVERYNHAHKVGYLPASQDATVSYGTIDFRFKNSRKNPILIKTSAKNGILTIEIHGKKEQPEYEIEIFSKITKTIPNTTKYEYDKNKENGYEKIIQYGEPGYNSYAYKIYKLNGVEVKRELLSEDKYIPMNRYIKRGTKEPQEIPVSHTNTITNTNLPKNDVNPTEPTKPKPNDLILATP